MCVHRESLTLESIGTKDDESFGTHLFLLKLVWFGTEEQWQHFEHT